MAKNAWQSNSQHFERVTHIRKPHKRKVMKNVLTLLTLLLFGLNSQTVIAQAEICWNRVDDDGDGDIDCADTDCATFNFCFECDDRFYQVINNRYLATLDIENQWYKDIFVLNGVNQINGAAMNPIDGHTYASAVANGQHILVLVGNDGKSKSTRLGRYGNTTSWRY